MNIHLPLFSQRRRQAVAAIALGLSGSCSQSQYPKLAGRYAADEVAAAVELAPMGGIAYRLCRKQAAYAFLVKAQQSDVEPPPWPRWYGEEPGPDTPAASLRPVTWSQTCDESARAAQVVHTVCRGLRAHGKALASLASGPGQPLDTSAIENTTNLVLFQVAGMSTTSGVGKAAAQVGSNFANASKVFLDAYRTRKLEEVVRDSKTCIDSTFDDLLALQKNMVLVLADVRHRRTFVVRGMASAPLPPRGDRGLLLGEAMDAVGETDRTLQATDDALTTYKIAITRLKAAYASLAKLAAADPRDPGSAKDVAGGLDDLESSLQDVTELEQ
ncbi:MAG TPA: hypothetical protein VE987_07185 [Polyangiaceae bacterium]|nr:hypothetical protein [Polyangiaceae bacterium]